MRFKREIIGVSALLILGSLFILYPFLDAIIFAIATSYLLRSMHRRLNSKLHNNFLSSLIVVSTIVGVIFLGTFLFINNFTEVSNATTGVAENMQNKTQAVIQNLETSEDVKMQLQNQLDKLLEPENVRSHLEGIIASLPGLFIDLGIFLVTAIYLFRDGTDLKRKFFSLVEDLPDNEEKIVRTLTTSIDSIFRGVFLTQFTVAAILGLITGIGFYLIGSITTPIPFTILWAVLIGIAALMPLFAAFMIYGPIGFYYLFVGMPVKGTLILAFGTIVLNVLPEVFLRPYVGSKQMNEHPLIIFIGFIAGPLTLGLKGLVLGPVLLILSKDFIMNYSELVSDLESSRSEDTENQ